MPVLHDEEKMPMTRQMTSRAILSTLALLLAAAGCDAVQPKPPCRAQAAEYAARYDVDTSKPMTGNCNGKVLKAEILHMQAYASAPDDPKKTPSLAIEPESVVAALEEAMNPANAGLEYSIGKFDDSLPDDSNVCKVQSMAKNASITAGGNSLAYTWSNVQMFVTPLSNGIHFGADLARKDGDCTVNYKVVAVYPANHCGDGKDMMGNDDPTTGKPVQSACEPVEGSGLSPDFDYTCESTSLLCLVNGKFPAFKAPEAKK
jgi:hypothetical protein